MKRFILVLAFVASAFGATQMKIENGVLVNDLNANNQKVINLPAPTNPNEAANKAYVDSVGGGGSGGSGLPIMGGHAGQALFTDGVIAFWQLVPWASISGKPTTLAGYGITDPIVLTTGSYANPTWITSLGWAKISGTPTTLAGYGIATPLPIGAIPTGTSSSTVAIGNDSRFSANVTGLRKSSGNGSTDVAAVPGTDYVVPGTAGAGDVISNTGTSVVGEVATFADTGGKLVGRSTGTGIATLSSGVLGATSTVSVTQGGTGQTTINTGEIAYGSAPNTVSRLAGNSTTTPMYLRSLGSGTAATAPSWVQIPFADLASKPTTISGYGITDAQPLDGDLTSIAGLSTTGVIPYRSAANTWGTVTIGSGLSFNTSTGTLAATGVGSGDVTGPSSSSDSEIAIFSGTTGKTLKRASATVSGTGLGKVSSGVLSMASVNIDYGVPSLSTFNDTGGPGPSPSPTPTSWPTGITMMVQSVAQTANRYSLLPPANAYAAGTVILYGDGATVLNYGRGFRPSGSDTLDGQTNAAMATAGIWLTPFIAGGVWGQGTYQFLSNGSNGWISLFANARADRISSSTNAQQYITFDVSNQPTSPHYVARFANTGDSSTVSQLVDPGAAAQRPFVNSFDQTTGILGTNFVRPADLQITQDDIVQSNILPASPSPTPGTHAVNPSDGTVDTVRLSATLSKPLTITLPGAGAYGSGEPITFFDRSGSISSSNTVTIQAASGETINGNPTVTINAPYTTLTLRSDNTSNWSYYVPTSTSSAIAVSPYTTLTDAAGGTISQGVDLTVAEQHWKLASTGSTANTRNISITGARDGERGVIEFTHNSNGGDTFTILNSRTPSGGAGVLNLSTTAGAVDIVEWKMIGTKLTVTDVVLNVTAPTTLTCATAGLVTGTAATTGPIQIGNTTARKFVAYRFTAHTDDSSGGPGFTTSFCNTKVAVFNNSGSIPSGQIQQYIYTDGGSGLPGVQVTGAVSSPVDFSAVTATDIVGAVSNLTTFAYSSNVTLTNGTTYFMVFSSTAPISTSANFRLTPTTGSAVQAATSSDGATWTSIGGGGSPPYWQALH